MEQSTKLLLSVVGLVFVLLLRRIFTRQRSLKHIAGPPSRSWLLGNNISFFYQDNVGDLDFQYVKQYGTTWRMSLPFGNDLLVLADPKAIQHVMLKSGYAYVKRIENVVGNELVMGRGVVWAAGEAHVRQRKILTPAFTANQLRLFIPLFRASAAKLTQRWKEDVMQNSDTGVDMAVNRWFARATLDIIGEAAFDYDFGAMENKDNRVSKAYHNMFSDSVRHPRAWDVLFKATWKHLPAFVLSLVKYIPTREYTRFRKTRLVIEGMAQELVDEKREAYLAGDGKNKDILSILVRANASQDPSTRLSDEEMISQMGTLTFAGHETTANTLSWCLFELAKIPEYQKKMRADIAAARGKLAERGDTDFSLEDLESMPYVSAAVKETLRYHPVIYHLSRQSAQDDVIPLAYPIYSTSGEVITEIPINKGQGVLIDICAYNRLPELWGQDAHMFNPMRWIDSNIEKESKVGVYANLMTFSAGVRSCIGWRFSVIETLALLVELIENFNFALPTEKAEVMRVPTGLMTAMVRGKEREGVQMPLHVSPVREE